jgi:hypothetical protein
MKASVFETYNSVIATELCRERHFVYIVHPEGEIVPMGDAEEIKENDGHLFIIKLKG